MHQRLQQNRHLLTQVAMIVTVAGVVCHSGCSTTLFNRSSLSERVDRDPNHSIAGIQGPTERKLNSAQWDSDREKLSEGESSDSDMSADLETYEAAVRTYDEGRFADAEKMFKELTRKRRRKHDSLGARFQRFWGTSDDAGYDPYSNFGDPIEEDALFMIAETQFAQQKYAAAQNSYDELLNRYPSTRHLDKVTRQLFRIARYWLDFPEDVGETGDAKIQQASAEVPAADSAGKSAETKETSLLTQIAVVPNLTDRTRPTFDTYGRGLQALRSIWLHDATGPLADDALMLAANHHLRTENFVEAARLYGLLRDQYPDSPHFKNAFVLGSHVTLASYQGPAYDGKALEDARGLKQTLLQIFPELTPEERERFQREIEVLEEAEVARIWDLVEFYQTKRVDASVALHCYLIINKYPESKYAERARETLRGLEAKKQQVQAQAQSASRAKSPSRASSQGPGITTLSPSGSTSPSGRQNESRSSESGSNQSKRNGGWFGNLLRRAEEPPKLQPVEEKQQAPSGSEQGAPGRVSL